MEIPLIGRLHRRAPDNLPADPPPAVDAVADAPPAPVRLRYQFPGPMRVGHTSKLPSGRTYKLYAFGTREFYVSPEDVDALLGFQGECCHSHKKRPLFERA